MITEPTSNTDVNVPQATTILNKVGRWISHKVTCCCGGKYSNSMEKKVNCICTVAFGLCIGAIILGSFWRDKFDDKSAIAFSAAIGFLFFITITSCTISKIAYNCQEPRPENSCL